MSGQAYDRLKKVSIEETMSAIGIQVKYFKEKGLVEALKNGNKSKRTMLDGVEVHLTSLRLLTFFQKGTVCSCCGLKASYFAFERNAGKRGKPAQGSYHLNLWGVNEEGEEVLFTHDHTVYFKLYKSDHIKKNVTTEGSCIKII